MKSKWSGTKCGFEIEFNYGLTVEEGKVCGGILDMGHVIPNSTGYVSETVSVGSNVWTKICAKGDLR